jgi:predicted dienelactone hydrolase
LLHIQRPRRPLRFGLSSLLGAAAAALLSSPAHAVEDVTIQLPLLKSSFSVKVSELKSARSLLQGTSDLAELDRASQGALGRQLLAVLNKPLPMGVSRMADGAVGSPMLEQALLILSSFGTVDGKTTDLSGAQLREALLRSSNGSSGPPSLLALIQALPGTRVTLNLQQAERVLTRLASQRRQAEQMLAAANAAPAGPIPAGQPVRRRLVQLAVAHRPQPLDLELIQPAGSGNGRLVLISHGLWDSPDSFDGWGALLASQGYTVILPRHPGSDSNQQRAMLAGTLPPPNREELQRRPRDLSAVIDAVQQGRLGLSSPVDSRRVVVMGHSWGATTALQLAGVRAGSSEVSRCSTLNDPQRNLSWTLQCSWLQGLTSQDLTDQRVVAVAAVSPPVSLLFATGARSGVKAPILLVSGSNDWVVPPDPEAIEPMRRAGTASDRLVLAQGGDHFNLRPGSDARGGVLGPLLLQWTASAFANTALPAAGWGSPVLALMDVSGRLSAKAQP